MEEVFRVQLVHILGADAEAHNMAKIYRRELHSDLKPFFGALSMFYKLESTKYNTFNDQEINSRMKRFDRCIHKIDVCMKNYLVGKFDFERQDVDAQQDYFFEDIFIYCTYSGIVKNLKEINDIFEKYLDKKGSLDWKCFKCEGIGRKSYANFFDRFYGEDKITKLQRSNASYAKRILRNKELRFHGEDRLKYWENICEKYKDERWGKTINSINSNIGNILEGNNRKYLTYNLGFLLMCLLEKYHILCHKIAENMRYNFFTKDDNGDYKVIKNFIDSKDTIIRCQKVFTFIRLIAKYYPEQFSNLKGTGSSDLIQIESYVRRGYTYYLFGKGEEAFNDYTHAQRMLKLLPNDTEIFLKYKEIFVPVCIDLKAKCYRQDYSYESAFQYYCKSVVSFYKLQKQYEKGKKKKTDDVDWGKIIVPRSFRLILVEMHKAEMFLELGDFRRSLKWFLLALQQIIELFEYTQNNKNKEAKRDAVKDFELLKKSLKDLIDYLDDTKYDPVIEKRPLYKLIRGFLVNFISFKSKNDVLLKNECKGTILLSDICNKIGILLYLVRFPHEFAEDSEQIKSLPYEWLKIALEFDKSNGLAQHNKLVFEIISGETLNIHSDFDYKIIRHEGSLFDRWTRHFATSILNSVKIKQSSFNDSDKKIAKDLLSRLLLYTDNFSLKNKELFKYLIRERKISQSNYEDTSSVILIHLRRWSSYTPCIPRPSSSCARGGGYFIVYNIGKDKNNKGDTIGIAVDPGFDFVLNLYQEGYSIDDIDAVIITHDHIDHYADFDVLLSLWHYKRKLDGNNSSKKRELFLNCGVMERYGFLLRDNNYNVYPLRHGSIVKPLEKGYEFEIHVKKATHKELSTSEYSIGFIMQFPYQDDKGKKFQIGFTGDTEYEKESLQEYCNSDILVLNVNCFPFKEIKHFLKIHNNKKHDNYSRDLKSLFETVNDNNDLKNIANQIKFAYWYESTENNIFKPSVKNYNDLKLGDHLFLRGALEINKLINNAQVKPQLVFISELREEIGSFRNKLANFLNDQNKHIFGEEYIKRLKYLTSDIGISAKVQLEKAPTIADNNIQVACSRCKLSNDAMLEDIYHPMHDIIDFCIKGEDEGIFCLCRRHDTTDKMNNRENELFFQRIERYNLFERIPVKS